MTLIDPAARAWLLYRASCRKCRVLSRLLAVCSFGTVQRIAHDSLPAQFLLGTAYALPIKVTLVSRGRVYSGAQVLFALLIADAAGLLRLLWSRDAGSECVGNQTRFSR